MEWSLSKVMRIESGEVTISTNDLRPLLTFLGITDKTRVDELVRAAKMSRIRQQWWDQPRYREHLTPAMRLLIQYEVEATVARYFTIAAMPGRLQVPSYAQGMLRTFSDELTAEKIEVRLDARLRRRNELLSREEAPQIFLLLDESVLHREVGATQARREQLLELLKRSREDNFFVRVMPFATDAPVFMYGQYEILYLGEDRDTNNAIMYRETHTSDEIIEDTATIDIHQTLFDKRWAAALDEDDSIDLIERHTVLPGPVA
jgi:hypothetical protein